MLKNARELGRGQMIMLSLFQIRTLKACSAASFRLCLCRLFRYAAIAFSGAVPRYCLWIDVRSLGQSIWSMTIIIQPVVGIQQMPTIQTDGPSNQPRSWVLCIQHVELALAMGFRRLGSGSCSQQLPNLYLGSHFPGL